MQVGSRPEHASLDLYLIKVDAPESLKSQNLPKYPSRTMGLQWENGLDLTSASFSDLQKEVFQVGFDLFQQDMLRRADFPSYTTLEGDYVKYAVVPYQTAGLSSSSLSLFGTVTSGVKGGRRASKSTFTSDVFMVQDKVVRQMNQMAVVRGVEQAQHQKEGCETG